MKRDNVSQRMHDIDWLRIIAVVLLIPFHTAMIFCFWGFHLKNDELSAGLTVQNAFIGAWHMPLFFFLSGVGSWHALGFRSPRKYAAERVSRLFVPFVFGMLAICPPQLYFERLRQGAFSGSYIQFYPEFFSAPYPEGNLSWQHLWFLLYLFLMSLIALPLFGYLREPRGQKALGMLERLASGRFSIYSLIAPCLVIQCVAGEGWPNGDQNLIGDLDNFAQYLIVFVYGYALWRSAAFRERVKANANISAVAGILFFAASQIIEFKVPDDYFDHRLTMGLGWLILNSLKTWCMLLAVLGLGIKYLKCDNSVLKYAVDAALPFYIIHQTIIIFIGYYVVQTHWSIAAKYTFIVATSFAVTLAVYDLCVKRLNLTRFLFGMRLMKKQSNHDIKSANN